MSGKERFECRYATGDTPWELSRPDKHLVAFVKEHLVPPKRVLDIGCGTGSNARWMAQKGFDVLGIDFSPRAIELANQEPLTPELKLEFAVKDFLLPDVSANDFDFVFDRGCFHSFERALDRSTFARQVHHHLKAEGLWMSILGNSDDEPRDTGPPMRSAGQIITAVEPFFELLHLKSDRFDSNREKPARCWLCIMKKRGKK